MRTMQSIAQTRRRGAAISAWNYSRGSASCCIPLAGPSRLKVWPGLCCNNFPSCGPGVWLRMLFVQNPAAAYPSSRHNLSLYRSHHKEVRASHLQAPQCSTPS